MLIHTCARGEGVGLYVVGMPPKINDKNGAMWCILSVPKYVIINLKINNFRIMINQQPKFCAIFSPRSIQMRMLVQKYIQILKGAQNQTK